MPNIETCVGVVHIIDTVITRTDDGSSSLAPDSGPLIDNDGAAAADAGGPTAAGPAGAADDTTAAGEAGSDEATTVTTRDAGDTVADGDASDASGLHAALGSLAAVVVVAVAA